ncbi:MAG TPA: NAD(P)/FAD-dependent oxidoreductase [Actinomycetes bacterium]|nr:NAD(P)/FAD-dependent oxidoreductase [Actinomycetes bacterium]
MHAADVIVVGAGLAGLRAARDLADVGQRVLVLESRDRVGGRGWTSTFPGTNAAIELGGSWFTEHQKLVAAELDRYGLGTRTFEPVTETRWRTGGELRLDSPIAASDTTSLAQWQQIQNDALQMADGTNDPRWSLSLDEYLKSMNATEVVVDLLYGWWSITGGGLPTEGCVEGVLGAITSEGPVGDMSYLRYAPEKGWLALAEAMAATPGIELRLNTLVTEVNQRQGTVSVVNGDGVFTAPAAIVAAPVNTLPNIAFDPMPPTSTSAAFGQSAGKAIKVWLLTRGVPPRSLAFGRGESLNWFYGDRDLDGNTLVVGFGWPIDGFNADDTEHIQRALHTFYPDAELLAHIRHDWIHDPSAQGTWVNTAAGNPSALRADNFKPFGSVAFATSDFASDHSGWFEGALVSGSQAARWANN